jgi:prepilin-type N-terminal cleavage/methylation domain-containing protein
MLDDAGFTLMELIAALILVAVLAAMIFPVTRYGLEQTARGVGDCRELFELQGQMEQIIEIYKTQLATGTAGDIDLVAFRDTVSGYSYVDAVNTGFLDESGGALTLTGDTTRPLFLVTLVSGSQRISSIFSR